MLTLRCTFLVRIYLFVCIRPLSSSAAYWFIGGLWLIGGLWFIGGLWLSAAYGYRRIITYQQFPDPGINFAIPTAKHARADNSSIAMDENRGLQAANLPKHPFRNLLLGQKSSKG